MKKVIFWILTLALAIGIGVAICEAQEQPLTEKEITLSLQAKDWEFRYMQERAKVLQQEAMELQRKLQELKKVEPAKEKEK